MNSLSQYYAIIYYHEFKYVTSVRVDRHVYDAFIGSQACRLSCTNAPLNIIDSRSNVGYHIGLVSSVL